jgi:hypothetical protein
MVWDRLGDHVYTFPLTHPPPLPPPRMRRQVAVPRSWGLCTVGRVVATRPGWVCVEVEPGGASKDVPEGDVYLLLEGLRLA